MAEWYNEWFNEDYLNLYADRDVAEAERHVAFLIEKLHLTGDEAVLDLGCGAGRHAKGFAQRGYSVVGVDASPTLIAKARDEVPGVTFIQADVLDLQLSLKFDLILSLFTSFGYAEDDATNARLFARVKEHLKPQGCFFLDFLNPNQVKKNLVPSEERMVLGEKVQINRDVVGDMVVKTIAFPGRTYREQVKLYTRDQIEAMLGELGLSTQQAWGDYNGSSWNLDSPRTLLVVVHV